MKAICCAISVLLLGQCFALPQTLHGKSHPRSSKVIRLVKITPQAKKVGIDLCPTCISFTSQSIDAILNIILNVGVIGTCGELCQLVEQETGSQVLGAVCNILCDIVGIREFIKLIEKADLDPIYFCELLNVCPYNDNSDAKIDSYSITPKSGPQGTTFEMDLAYSTKNGTGTGEIVVLVETVDGIPLEHGFIREAQPPGSYGATIQLRAEPDPDCDPTQGPCETWEPGVYKTRIDVCDGECGSKHPHSKIFGRAYANFTITG